MNKGFTLIELLAVIVILAIIALIATPIILNIIEDSQKSAATNSAGLYVDGLTKKVMSENMSGEFNPSSCTITNGNITCDGETIDYTVDGDKPTSGTITFTNGVVSGYTIVISGYTVTKSGSTVTTTKGEPEVVPPAVVNTIFEDDFEDYEVDTLVSSGTMPYSLIYNGTGNGNQKVITAEQLDGTSGKVLKLEGASNWSANARHSFTPDEEQYLVLEADIKPVSGSTPGGFNIGSSYASGTWSKAVCGTSFGNNGFNQSKEDTGTVVDTEVTYTSGNWYHVKLILDQTNHVFYILIDGTLLDSNGFTAANATPEWLEIAAGNTGTNVTYYDNVRLYSTDTSGI